MRYGSSPHCWSGAQYDVAERRVWLLDSAEDVLAHAALIARALSALGHKVGVDRLYKRAERGRTVAKTVDMRGWPLYRIGDALGRPGKLANSLSTVGNIRVS